MPWYSKETIKNIIDMQKECPSCNCGKCTEVMKRINVRMNDLDKEVKQLKSDFSEMKGKQIETEKKVDEVRNEFKTASQKIDNNNAKSPTLRNQSWLS